MSKILKTDILRAEATNISIEGTPKLADSAIMGTDPKSLATKEYVDDKKLTTNITTSASITPTGNSIENELFVTALLEDASFNAPSGTVINGNTLLFRIYSASAQTLTWDAIYYGFIEPLPTTTLAGKEMYLAFIYNGRASKWDYVAKTLEV
jgi:hypothetical protein